MFGTMLRDWRTARGLSQLDIAVEAEVSPRHVSFLESGRSRPSQSMVLRLAEAMGLPLRERNALLVSAGYAPCFGERDESAAGMAEVMSAIRLILSAHPYPALALDHVYDIVDAYGPFRELGASAGLASSERQNLAELVLRPGPLRDSIVNWPEVAAYMVHRIRESRRLRGPLPKLDALLHRVLHQPGVKEAAAAMRSPAGRAILPVELRLGGQTTRWITTLTTFGAPQDAFVEELTIEQFHPLRN